MAKKQASGSKKVAKTKSKRTHKRQVHPEGLKDPLVFVDTNILLDFYRAKTEQSLKFLSRLEDLADRSITTYQVQMEFKKNRQRVLFDSIASVQSLGSISPPAFLRDSKSVKATHKKIKVVNDRIKSMETRLIDALHNPATKDPVYQSVQRLFNIKSEFNLNRCNEDVYRCVDRVRRLAMKRFMLGYPPRKNSDTSVGDAVNWEWCVMCAKKANRDLVIVSRDSDFGLSVKGSSHINDWLASEFKSRINMQSQVRLTGKLSEALPWLELDVSEEERAGEQELIETSARVAEQAGDNLAQRSAVRPTSDPDAAMRKMIFNWLQTKVVENDEFSSEKDPGSAD